MTRKYWDDLIEGQELQCGQVEFDEAGIIEFAKKYDPQPFHVDEQAARESIFGGIIASALHTLSACTRVVVEAQGDLAILSGLGMYEATMFNPVRPMDVLSVEAKWVELKRSRSKPGRGFAGIKCKVFNQNGDPVMEYGYRYLVKCRQNQG